MPTPYEKPDHRQEVTNKIIEMLEKGTAPWQKPWLARPAQGLQGKTYRGGNQVWLSAVAIEKGYDDPRWMTFKQANDNGFKVRKGEKGTRVEFWKFDKDVKQADGSTKTEPLNTPMVRYYTVFNASQVEGDLPPLPKHEQFTETEAMERAQKLLDASGAKIINLSQNRAFYRPSDDFIVIPSKEQFASGVEYYATATHELSHWTGHESRLNRDLTGDFGTPSYAKEELRAELGSLFIQSELGIPHDTEQHAAYVGSWIQALRNDKNEIFRASQDASKISEFIMSFAPELSQKNESTVTEVPNSDNKVVATTLPQAEPNKETNAAAVDGITADEAKIQKWVSKATEKMQYDPFSDDPLVEAQRRNPRNVQHTQPMQSHAPIPNPNNQANAVQTPRSGSKH